MPNASLGYLNNSASGSLLFSTADSMAFATNSTQRMRLLKSGDVLVGNGAPLGKMHIAGSGSAIYSPVPSDYDYSLAAFAIPDTVTTTSISSVGVLGFGKGSAEDLALSPMKDFSSVMTVQELKDVVAYLTQAPS